MFKDPCQPAGSVFGDEWGRGHAHGLLDLLGLPPRPLLGRRVADDGAAAGGGHPPGRGSPRHQEALGFHQTWRKGLKGRHRKRQ